jgi:hypothetical protein
MPPALSVYSTGFTTFVIFDVPGMFLLESDCKVDYALINGYNETVSARSRLNGS